MTTRDLAVKWLVYTVVLLPGWFAQAFLFSSFPIFGVKPVLLPLCAVALATLEGSVGGAGFGLAVGVLFDAAAPGFPGAGVLFMTLIGLCTGLLARYVLRQDLVGCFLCSALALAALDALRVLARLLTGAAPLDVLLTVAGKEILLSLCFVPPVYLLFRWAFDRVPKPTVL